MVVKRVSVVATPTMNLRHSVFLVKAVQAPKPSLPVDLGKNPTLQNVHLTLAASSSAKSSSVAFKQFEVEKAWQFTVLSPLAILKKPTLQVVQSYSNADNVRADVVVVEEKQEVLD